MGQATRMCTKNFFLYTWTKDFTEGTMTVWPFFNLFIRKEEWDSSFLFSFRFCSLSYALVSWESPSCSQEKKTTTQHKTREREREKVDIPCAVFCLSVSVFCFLSLCVSVFSSLLWLSPPPDFGFDSSKKYVFVNLLHSQARATMHLLISFLSVTHTHTHKHTLYIILCRQRLTYDTMVYRQRQHWSALNCIGLHTYFVYRIVWLGLTLTRLVGWVQEKFQIQKTIKSFSTPPHNTTTTTTTENSTVTVHTCNVGRQEGTETTICDFNANLQNDTGIRPKNILIFQQQ